ncbi:MAG TPA: magnesium/cobalt transporter CorA [Methylibium sp.]|uniref:magnesium/cobalt transporter CorA n=1 Tax=Methylibium sp. TaxID=2067992 RepID=UPI002DB5B689|nr:magnesium/cobalt transporter CorA [Methylibium sp.]HEU4458019.1 magnesium/cobalt transporter CorA [Methylibium sp.]
MLINCVAYREGKKLAELPVERISEYVAQPGCFVWVALHDATAEELAEMRDEFGLHELAVEDALHGHQRPKIEEYGDSIFAVMHLVQRDAAGNLQVGEVDVFVGHNYVLSVRSRSNEGFRIRERAEREPHLLKHGAGYVLYALMDAVVDRYFPILDALESELETVEERIFDKGTAKNNIERLYDLKRKLTVLKHAVAPLLEAASKLHGGRTPYMCRGTQEYFRDVVDHLLRINASIDAIRETIGTAIQVNVSMVAIEEGEVTKRLAAWAGIFAVATAFAGIWGMNFEAMPELKWQWGYPMALAVIAASCGFVAWRFRRAGWL